MTLPPQTPLLVGIGSDTAQRLPTEVLSYSILRNTASTPAITALHETAPWRDLTHSQKKKQRTPFSFQRFLLAQQVVTSRAQFGVYLDSDMLMLQPIERLIEEFIDKETSVATVAPLGAWNRRRQSSVLVMNRAGAEELSESYAAYKAGSIDYDTLIYLSHIRNVGSLSYRWNCLEYLDEQAALIHYTDMDTQPWLRDGNPNAGIWYTYLWRYVQQPRGLEVLQDEIAKGHVRPSLMQVARQGPSLSAFSTLSHLSDLRFVPPHRFSRIIRPHLRRWLAPLLKMYISLQFAMTNGQPNIR